MAPDHEISGVKVDKDICTPLPPEILKTNSEEVKHQFKSPMPVIAVANNANSHNKKLNGIVEPDDGMPVPVTQLYPPGLVSLEWLKIHKVGAGLANLGNSCFLNSVMQCLTYTPPLTNYLMQDDHLMHCKMSSKEFCMMCEMQKHTKEVFQNSGDVIRPEVIYNNLQCIADHFQSGKQEDAHEFLRFVIENLWRSSLDSHLEEDKLDPVIRETTVINHIFGGYSRSQVVCLRCKRKSDKYEHFMDFILDIKHNIPTLEKAVEQFFKPELLDEDNAYRCPKCNADVPAEKTFSIHRAPNIATFQFKRFDFNKTYGKITKHVLYSEKLDLRPFMSEKRGMPLMYRLYAVIVHVGPNCTSGHYYCYIRSPNGCWNLMDDTRVRKVSLHEVLSEQAYVLLYVKSPSENGVHAKKNGILSVLSSPNGKIRSSDERTKEMGSPVTPKSARRALNLNFDHKLQPSREASSPGTFYYSSKNGFQNEENGVEHDEHGSHSQAYSRQNGDSSDKLPMYQRTAYDKNSSPSLKMPNGAVHESPRKKNSLCNGFTGHTNGVDSGYKNNSWKSSDNDYVPCTNSSLVSQTSSSFDNKQNSLRNGDHLPSHDFNRRTAQRRFSSPHNKSHRDNGVIQNGCGNGDTKYDMHNNVSKNPFANESQYKNFSRWESSDISRNQRPRENGSVAPSNFYNSHQGFREERHRKGISSYHCNGRNASNNSARKNYRNGGYENLPECRNGENNFFRDGCESSPVHYNDGHKKLSSDLSRDVCERKFSGSDDHYDYSERWRGNEIDYRSRNGNSERYRDAESLNGERKRNDDGWNRRTYDNRSRKFDNYGYRNYQGKMKHNKHFSSRTVHCSSFQRYKDFRRSNPYTFDRHRCHRKSF